MPFHTRAGTITLSEALFRVLVYLERVEEESEFVGVLLDMARTRDSDLFDAVEMAIRDVEEIALVKLAEDTVIYVDQGNSAMNFWNREHWLDDSDWKMALATVGESQYTQDRIRQSAKQKYAPHPGYVYLVSCEEGYCKIGRSKDPDTRVVQFRTLPPFKFELEHMIPADDDREAESELHHRFADKRVNGEWFRLDEDDVDLIKAFSRYELGKFHSSAT